MIRMVRVENYKSIAALTLELGRVTVLIGANGSGKSNLYRSLRLLADCGEGRVIGSLAAVGGLDAVRWAGPEQGSGRGRAVQGTVRSGPVALRLGVATDERTPPSVAPFAIGATVFAGALVTGPLTGGSFNPARSLGPSVAGGVWTAHWLYWVAPVLGMVMGMRLYDLLRARAPSGAAPLGVEGPIA